MVKGNSREMSVAVYIMTYAYDGHDFPKHVKSMKLAPTVEPADKDVL
jgi:hypothetical protein